MSVTVKIHDLIELNSYLECHSYIEGYTATQADNKVFEWVDKEPSNEFPHAARWYRLIAASSAKQRSEWPQPKLSWDVFASCPVPISAPKVEEEDDDDDIDLFGEDNEDDIKARQELADQRRKEQEARIVNTKGDKSALILEVKPYDAETDMKDMELRVREIQNDGLLWGASKLVDVAYGVKKLLIAATIVDEVVSSDFLEESICDIEIVQSMDIASWNKV